MIRMRPLHKLPKLVNMKQLTMATRESSANLVARMLTSIPENAQVGFPKERFAEKTIRRVRAGQRPPVPDSLQDLLTWATTDGDNPEGFVIFDNGQAAACGQSCASLPLLQSLQCSLQQTLGLLTGIFNGSSRLHTAVCCNISYSSVFLFVEYC